VHVNTDIHTYLQKRLPTGRDGATVLEIGAGQGTVSLSKLFHTTAIEHDPEYMNLTDRAEYIYAPLVPYSDDYFRDATLWYDWEVLEEALEGISFSAIIVDGPKGSQGRGGFFTNLDLFRAEMYIFDDTHRMWEFRLAGRVADRFGVPFETYTNGRRWFSVVKPNKSERDEIWNGR
jgi:hypothetical protein